jgi:methionine-rich copper-binding protein CopC
MSNRAKARTAVPLTIAAMLVAILGAVRAMPATANANAQTLPFNQDWSNTGLITADDNWNAVQGIVGFTGGNLASTEGLDPQGVLVDDPAVDVAANLTDVGTLAGGVAEFELANPTIALKGFRSATAPNIVISLNTTGKTNVFVSYNLRDIDDTSANSISPVAVQYRVGGSGTFTNLPAGFVDDATQGPNQGGLVTPVEVGLPAAANDQSLVQVRIITANAVGPDEWVGVDDISVIAAEDDAPFVQSTVPAGGATNILVGSNLSVTFSEPVNLASGWFSISCGLSGAHGATVSGGPTHWVLNPTTPFDHSENCTLRVKARSVTDVDTIDPPDRMALDATATFRTIPPDDAPTVTATAPVDGATNVPIADNLGVVFSEPVDTATGAFTVSCSTTGAHAVTVSGGPTSFSLDPNAAFGSGETCSLTGPGATVTDQDVNDPPDAVAGDTTVSFTTPPPPDPAPTVTATTPADGATGVATGANLGVTFSEPVDVASGWYDITCGTSGAHTAAVSGGPTSFTLDPDSDFANSESCTLTVHAAQVTDQDTNDPPDAMVGDVHATFTTVAPPPPDDAPTVAGITPADQAVDVPVNSNVSVTFSEPVDVGQGWATLTCDTSGSHSVAASGGPTTWTLDPDADFAQGEACHLTVVGANVSDQDANDPPDTMAGNATATFTTLAGTPPVDLPPTVDAGGPYAVEQGATVQVAATGTDPENQAITYAWDLDGDGTFETAGQTATFSAAGLVAPTSRTISVRGTDPGGHSDVKTATVNVTWHNGGFGPPLGGNNGPVTQKAGSNVPVKFSLGGNHGMNILRAGYPASGAYTCGGTVPTDATEAIPSPNLKYDPATDMYSFQWKTDRAWSNTCRVMVVGLTDGQNLTVAFQFR